MVRASALSTATSISDVLREDIVLGRLYPCERLIEDDLMARFNAKRHVIRTSLQMLVQQGLADKTPDVGVAVKSFTREDVEDLYETRILLESNAVRLISLPVSDQDLLAVSRACDEHRRAVERGDQPAIVESNDRFHSEIFLLTGNRILAETIRLLAQKASPIRFLNVSSDEKMQRSAAEHDQIVAALRGTNIDLLADLCREHLLPTQEHYLQTLALKAK